MAAEDWMLHWKRSFAPCSVHSREARHLSPSWVQLPPLGFITERRDSGRKGYPYGHT